MGNDPWFRGIALKYGPDGGVFVSDWTDLGECHDRDGVHRRSGRIYKITFGRSEYVETDLSRLSNGQLVQLQMHRNDWFVRHARRILQERAAEGQDMMMARQALLGMFDEREEVTKLMREIEKEGEAWYRGRLFKDRCAL